MLCNYGEAKNDQKPPSEWRVWEASLATSAAPFYFPPFDDKFVDGGVMANNPTLIGYQTLHACSYTYMYVQYLLVKEGS